MPQHCLRTRYLNLIHPAEEIDLHFQSHKYYKLFGLKCLTKLSYRQGFAFNSTLLLHSGLISVSSWNKNKISTGLKPIKVNMLKMFTNMFIISLLVGKGRDENVFSACWWLTEWSVSKSSWNWRNCIFQEHIIIINVFKSCYQYFFFNFHQPSSNSIDSTRLIRRLIQIHGLMAIKNVQRRFFLDIQWNVFKRHFVLKWENTLTSRKPIMWRLYGNLLINLSIKCEI